MTENQPTTQQDELEPFNDVERLIVAGASGETENNQVISGLLSAGLFFLSSVEPNDSTKTLEPLVLQGPDGKPVLPIFTHPARVAQQFLDAAPYAVSIKGAEAFMQAGELGIAINPGHPLGLVLQAQDVATIRGLLTQNVPGADSAEA